MHKLLLFDLDGTLCDPSIGTSRGAGRKDAERPSHLFADPSEWSVVLEAGLAPADEPDAR